MDAATRAGILYCVHMAEEDILARPSSREEKR